MTSEELRRDIEAIDKDIERIKADPNFVHSLDSTMTKTETIAALERIRVAKVRVFHRSLGWQPEKLWWENYR